MTEKRNITREDTLLKARMLAEGVRFQVKGTPLWDPRDTAGTITHPIVVLDGCGVIVGTQENPRSRLEVAIEGSDACISEMGEDLATGTLVPRAPWLDRKMSDGVSTVGGSFMYDTAMIATILTIRGCATHDAGQGCKYCEFGPMFSQTAASLFDDPHSPVHVDKLIEATALAIRSGWRGLLLIVGGAAPPERRGQWTTDMIEDTMTRLRRAVDDDDAIAELQMATDLYPPDDLGDLYKWKSFGINACEFDCEIMDPAYFKAICPGRGEQRHWQEAQEAAAEVFGRGRGSFGNTVTGIEPMAGLLEGIEERLSKGVYMKPVTFYSAPLSPMAGMQGATAEWLVEVAEKTVDLYFKYGDTFDIPLTEDTRWGYTRRGQTHHWVPADDEMVRRLQEMGKLPPGLPKQDGIELA